MGIAAANMRDAVKADVFTIYMDGFPTTLQQRMTPGSYFAKLSGDNRDIARALGCLDEIDLVPQAERLEREFAKKQTSFRDAIGTSADIPMDARPAPFGHTAP